MTEKKLKVKSKTVFPTILLIWFLLASFSSARNQELGTVAGAMSETLSLGTCSIETKIERDWPFGWTATHMNIKITEKDTVFLVNANRFEQPNRTYLKSSNTEYHYTWARPRNGDNDFKDASYIKIELDRSRQVEKIVVAKCQDFPRNEFFVGELEHCNSDIELVECT